VEHSVATGVDDGHGRGIGVQRLGFPPEGCGLASGGDLTGAEKVRAQGQYGAVAEALGEQGGLIRGGRVRAPSGRHHPVARGEIHREEAVARMPDERDSPELDRIEKIAQRIRKLTHRQTLDAADIRSIAAQFNLRGLQFIARAEEKAALIECASREAWNDHRNSAPFGRIPEIEATYSRHHWNVSPKCLFTSSRR